NKRPFFKKAHLQMNLKHYDNSTPKKTQKDTRSRKKHSHLNAHSINNGARGEFKRVKKEFFHSTYSAW
ncbi:MAG: hypothetical protein Q7I97_02015, partial [Thermovirgaceae bacterium]|nr:hypothetical protein [Thermovirgaceae bacterium]